MKENYLRELVTLTRVSSTATVEACIEHLCFGKSQYVAADKYGVKQEAVARLTRRLVNLDQKLIEIEKLRHKENAKTKLPKATPNSIVEWVKEIEKHHPVGALSTLPKDAALEDIQEAYQTDRGILQGIGERISDLAQADLWPEQ